MSTSAPIFTDPSQLKDALRDDGYAVLRPQDVAALAGCPLAALRLLESSWNTLALEITSRMAAVTAAAATRASCRMVAS